MTNIGHFARQGRVSVRILRHYDAIRLLAPWPQSQGERHATK